MDKNFLQPYLGVGYCPYGKSGDIPKEFFGRDIATMKKLGINIFRPFVAWDRIEVEENKYDYSSLDTVFHEAEKQGLKIVLNVGGMFTQYASMYPPRYLLWKKTHEVVSDPSTGTRQIRADAGIVHGRSVLP